MSFVQIDPAQPKIELKLGKQTYQLCFTFASLAIAEAQLKKAGEPINIFHAFDFENLDASKMVALLYGALLPAQPETKLEDVPKMVSMKSIVAIKQALAEAFILSMAEPDEDQPHQDPTTDQ